MDCQNIGECAKMASDLYKEVILIPFMSKFVVFAKRQEPTEARLRVFCMTDDKVDKTLESQEHFCEIARSRDVEVCVICQHFASTNLSLLSLVKHAISFVQVSAFAERRHLRSSAHSDLVPCCRTVKYDQQSFLVSCLPQTIREFQLSLSQFCSRLKTFLFCRAYGSVSIVRCGRIKVFLLTYLLTC